MGIVGPGISNSLQSVPYTKSDVTIGNTFTLTANAQTDGNGYARVWNNYSSNYQSEWWKNGNFIDNSNPYGFTAQTNATYEAELRKNYKIARNDKTEFDGTILVNDVTRIVEQNSGTVPSPSTKTVGSNVYSFYGWESSANGIFTPTDNQTYPYAAQYKTTHKTNTSAAFANASQRKVVRTDDGYLFLCYESMNRVWLERSSNDGSSWTICNSGQPIDNGEAKQPSIDYLTDVDYYYQNNEIYVTYQQKTGSGTYTIQLARFNTSGQKLTDETIYTSTSSYSNNATPVVSVTWYYRAEWRKQIVGIWKEPSSLYWYGAYYLGSIFYWNDAVNKYYQISNTSGNSVNPTIDVYKYDYDARDGGTVYYPFAWEENSQSIKYGKVTCGYSGLGNSGVLSTISNFFSYNYRPTIIAFGNTNYRLSRKANLDSPESEGNELAVAILLNPVSPSTFWSFGSWVTNANMNKYHNELYWTDGYAIGWTQYYSSAYSNYAVKSSNLNSSVNLNSNGRDIHLYNSDSYEFEGMRGVTLSSSSPYAFQLSGNVENGQMGKSEGQEIALGRTGVVSVNDSVKGSAHFFFTLGDVMIDGQKAEFPEIADTIVITSAQQLNGYLISKPFTLNNSSKFSYSVEYGTTDSALAVSAVGASNLVRFSVDLLDASTGEMIGSFDEVKFNAKHIAIHNAFAYDVNTDGIGNRKVQLRLSVLTDLPAEYSLGSILVPGGRLLAKDGITKAQIGYQGSLAVSDYALSQNYPNPFNPSTTIAYQIPNAGHVMMKVYDVLGKEIATLVDGEKPAGRYTAVFDGSRLSSGAYIVRMNAGDFTKTMKVMLIK